MIDYLAERSFYTLSLSDVIRDELAKQGVEETRERMIDAGRALREEGGELWFTYAWGLFVARRK